MQLEGHTELDNAYIVTIMPPQRCDPGRQIRSWKRVRIWRALLPLNMPPAGSNQSPCLHYVTHPSVVPFPGQPYLLWHFFWGGRRTICGRPFQPPHQQSGCEHQGRLFCKCCKSASTGTTYLTLASIQHRTGLIVSFTVIYTLSLNISQMQSKPDLKTKTCD